MVQKKDGLGGLDGRSMDVSGLWEADDETEGKNKSVFGIRKEAVI